MTIDADTDAAPILLSPREVWDRVDPLGPDLGADPSVSGLAGLPYDQLRGPGFERLCYEVLVAEGRSPRFFGRPGQTDHGVDIIEEANAARTVYQCKNLIEEPSWIDIRNEILNFESKWLGKAGLPSPVGYVYCCPHSLDDRTFGEEWTRFKDAFRHRTGIEISFWDRNFLDARLRRLPDIVAGRFSDSYAEHFCGRLGWNDDPWTRVCSGNARHASIKRFLNRHGKDAIYVSAEEVDEFETLLASSPVLAIRGVSGAGKTLTSLELICRMRDPLRRVYYTTLKGLPNVQQLWQSVRRRNTLPAVFVLDDCHLDLEKARIVLERLTPELSDKRSTVRLLLIISDAPGPASGRLDDTPDWLVRLEQDGLIVDMMTNPERTRNVTKHLRPEWIGLSSQRFQRLHYLCGGDLLLLDEVLASAGVPSDLDTMRPDNLYSPLRSRYFDGNRILPTIKRLACLAQFDLAPLASFVDAGWLQGEKSLAAPLITEMFAPPRYQFLHPALAELMLRALLELEVGLARVDEGVAETTRANLLGYFKHLLTSSPGGPVDPSEFEASVGALLRGRLNLAERDADVQVKSGVLADETVRMALEENLDRYSFSFLRICLVTLSAAEHPAKAHYIDMVAKRFSILFNSRRKGYDEIGFKTLATGLSTLARSSPTTLQALERQYGAVAFLTLIVANGTLSELFRIMQYATPAFRAELLDKLSETAVRELINKTIASRRSIGTLNLAMREIGDENPALLGRLEQIIGAERVLRLLVANGTLFELFGMMQHATPAFRTALHDQLSETAARELINKTIAAGRSIGTLNLAMREIGDEDPALLGRLEQVIGAERFLRLIVANGTLSELFRIMQYATPAFRAELLDQLSETAARELINKTIAAKRSIGAFNLAMREIGDEDPALLGRLEQVIGAERFLRLIVANGTLSELFGIMKHATPAFRTALLDQLSEAAARELINKTIASGRSIGTLNLAMREIGDEDPALLGRLEQVIGAERFLRLIVANGTLSELFGIMKHATPAFRTALLDQLSETAAADLVDKTITSARSIGTLNLGMREIGDEDPALLGRLEQVIGAERFLRLIVANGTLSELFKIMEHATPAFRTALLDQLSENAARELINKTIASGRSIGTLNLAMREIGDEDPALLGRLEQVIGAERFLRLIVANGTLSELFGIMKHATPAFRTALLDQLSETAAADLVDKTLAAGRSIESLHFTLRQLARIPSQRERLEQLLGTDGWWRLTIGAGSLNSLSQITDAMSHDSRDALISASSALTDIDWNQILSRSLFLNACTFCSEKIAAYPGTSRDFFRLALGQTAHSLAAKASWFDLNPSRPPNDSVEGRILREAMQPRIAGITVDALVSGVDFREIINGLAFCWRERQDLRPSLGTRLWEILPEPASWPKDNGDVAMLGWILEIARSEMVPTQEAQRLNNVVVSFLDCQVCRGTHTLQLFLLLWNAAALRYERGEGRTFDGALPDALIEILLEVMGERVRAKGDNSERVAQFALAGLLGFLAGTLRKRLPGILDPLANSVQWLTKEALESTFVPALFAMEGLALLGSSSRGFTPQVRFGLLWKSKQYEDVGPAIEHLRERIKR